MYSEASSFSSANNALNANTANNSYEDTFKAKLLTTNYLISDKERDCNSTRQRRQLVKAKLSAQHIVFWPSTEQKL